jgi:hypothetical protein
VGSSLTSLGIIKNNNNKATQGQLSLVNGEVSSAALYNQYIHLSDSRSLLFDLSEVERYRVVVTCLVWPGGGRGHIPND